MSATSRLTTYGHGVNVLVLRGIPWSILHNILILRLLQTGTSSCMVPLRSCRIESPCMSGGDSNAPLGELAVNSRSALVHEGSLSHRAQTPIGRRTAQRYPAVRQARLFALTRISIDHSSHSLRVPSPFPAAVFWSCAGLTNMLIFCDGDYTCPYVVISRNWTRPLPC